MKLITDEGEEIILGTVETAPTIGMIDYSRRVTDDFGVTTVVERGFARRLSVRLAVPFEDVDGLQQRLVDLRATPAQWVADDRFAWLNVEGFYRDFELDLAVPPLSYCTLSVEGLAETEPGVDDGSDPAPAGSGSTLWLLQPVDITGAVLASSSVAETDYAAWAAGTNYAAGARVISAVTHRIYESAGNGNLGNDPTAPNGKWIDVGPTNRWAMFDRALGTSTSAAGVITVTFNATAINAVALLDVTAATVRVIAPGYDTTLPAGAGAVTFLDLPETTGEVTVTVTGPGQVSVGTLLLGGLAALGITEASPTSGINDFSRKDVDEFGEATIVQRAWAKRMSARALIRTDAVDIVANRIAAVRARPSLWIGDEGADSLTVYGFFKDFSIEVGESVSTLSLAIEGLSKAAKPGVLSYADGTPIEALKPAEPGATNSADPASPIGHKTVAKVITDAIASAEAIMTSALDHLARYQRHEALLHLSGQPVGTVVLQEVQERIEGQTAIVETISLIGAKSGDGLAFILDTDTVRVDPATTLAAKFTEISAEFGTVGAALASKASITQLNESVANEASARATAISALQATLEGQITAKASVTYVDTAISGEASARASSLSALQATLEGQITTKATVVQLNEAIATEAATRASAVTAVQTTANNAAATAGLALSTANGNEAKAVLSAGASGRIAQVTLNGATSAIAFEANSVYFYDDDGSLVLGIVDGVIRFYGRVEGSIAGVPAGQVAGVVTGGGMQTIELTALGASAAIVVAMAPGTSRAAEARFDYINLNGNTSVTLQVQASVDGGAYFDLVSQTLVGDVGEPVNIYIGGTYDNTSGALQTVRFRALASKTGAAVGTVAGTSFLRA